MSLSPTSITITADGPSAPASSAYSTLTEVAGQMTTVLQPVSGKGQPGGYASLDGAGLVPTAQIPAIPAVAVWGTVTGTLSAQTDLQAALDAKQAAGSYATGAQGALADTAVQPAGLTKAAVGLGNADNTSDANKPVSSATQTALNAKAATASLAPVATSGVYADLTSKPTLGTAAATAIGDYATAAQGTDARTPLAHKTSHENNGADEISVAGLSGVLADPQPPIIGAAGNQAVAGNDARLTDARTPTAHKTSHQDGGSDELALDASQTTTGQFAMARIASGTPTGAKFVRDDGVLAVPAGGGGANTLYAPGSFTVATGNFSIFADEVDLSGSQEATIEGTATLAVI